MKPHVPPKAPPPQAYGYHMTQDAAQSALMRGTVTNRTRPWKDILKENNFLMDGGDEVKKDGGDDKKDILKNGDEDNGGGIFKKDGGDEVKKDVLKNDDEDDGGDEVKKDWVKV